MHIRFVVYFPLISVQYCQLYSLKCRTGDSGKLKYVLINVIIFFISFLQIVPTNTHNLCDPAKDLWFTCPNLKKNDLAFQPFDFECT